MSGSEEAIDTSSSIKTHIQRTRSLAFWAFCLAIACCAINCMHRSFGTIILPYIRNDLNWSYATLAGWTGLLGFWAVFFSFVGGFIGDRTLKRKGFAGAGFLTIGIGILLIATMSAPVVKLGFVLAALGMLLFQGNILVVVAELAAGLNLKIENAFVIVFGVVIFGDSMGILVSMHLLEHKALYSTLVVLTLTFGLLWLLVLRNLPVTYRAEVPLALSSSRRKILLILAFVATRAISFIVMSAFEWTENEENTSPVISALFEQLGRVPQIFIIVCPVLVLLTVFWVIGQLRKLGPLLLGIRLIGLGFAAMGLTLFIIAGGAGDSILKHQISSILAHFALSAANACLFVGIATLTCTFVSNRWRGTVTALFAGVPQSGQLMTSIMGWHSWPLVLPLFAVGSLVLIVAGLWHLLVFRRLTTSQVIPESADCGDSNA